MSTLLTATPGQTIGPFYGYALPFPKGDELVPPQTPGAIRFHGSVTDGDGQPVPDVMLEIWQADAEGTSAVAGTTDFTADFQNMITRYAWGEIWTRPGLDRKSRSMITLTALIARGHHEELAMHVRAARRNGLTVDEIKEVYLQSAIYCGVPDANTAFRIASQALAED